MGKNVRVINGHARVKTRVLRARENPRLVCLRTRMSKKLPVNIHVQVNAGTACVSECILKTLACCRQKPKGDGGKGRQKKRHDNLRQTPRQFRTCYDN